MQGSTHQEKRWPAVLKSVALYWNKLSASTCTIPSGNMFKERLDMVSFAMLFWTHIPVTSSYLLPLACASLPHLRGCGLICDIINHNRQKRCPLIMTHLLNRHRPYSLEKCLNKVRFQCGVDLPSCPVYNKFRTSVSTTTSTIFIYFFSTPTPCILLAMHTLPSLRRLA